MSYLVDKQKWVAPSLNGHISIGRMSQEIRFGGGYHAIHKVDRLYDLSNNQGLRLVDIRRTFSALSIFVKDEYESDR